MGEGLEQWFNAVYSALAGNSHDQYAKVDGN